MSDEYKKSYLLLFNAVTDALEAMEEHNYGEAELILKVGQSAAEEVFLQQGEQG